MSEGARLRLLMNVALLGEVTCNMRAAMIRKVGPEVQTRFVFYKQPSEDDLEAASIANGEIIADFNKNETISEKYEVNESDKIVYAEDEEMVYRRKD